MAARYMDIICVNAYYGWFYGEAEDIRHHLRRLHERFPDKPIIISEFGAGAKKGYVSDKGPGMIWSEEYQARVYEHQLDMLADAGAKEIQRLAVQTPNDSGIITGIV